MGELGWALRNLQAHLTEIEALQACYPDLVSFSASEKETLQFAAAVVSGRSAAATAHDVPALSGTLWLPDVELAGAPVQLKFVLPRSAGRPASLQVMSNAPRSGACCKWAAFMPLTTPVAAASKLLHCHTAGSRPTSCKPWSAV
jgi:hypothetical protein